MQITKDEIIYYICTPILYLFGEVAQMPAGLTAEGSQAGLESSDFYREGHKFKNSIEKIMAR